MSRRLVAPGLAGISLLASVAGAGGFGRLVLLLAIVAASVRLLEAVGLAGQGRSDRFPVAVSVAGLACLVVAGATHVPLLVVGLLTCSVLELMGEVEARPDVGTEPVELV